MQPELFLEEKRIAKATTFAVLDGLPEGTRFSSIDLQRMVERRINQKHLPDTYMRYAREYRRGRRGIACVDKARSLYEVRA